MIEILGPLGIVSSLLSSAKKSADDKRTYEQKLEIAKGTEIYKYVLLINIAALEGYVAQARLQAQQSFNLSKGVAIAGFTIIAVAIVLSVALTVQGTTNLSAAYLAGVAGVLTEFTSGIFFFLYSKTLAQINVFHDKLVDMQKTALMHLSESARADDSPRGNETGPPPAPVGQKATTAKAVVRPNKRLKLPARVD